MRLRDHIHRFWDWLLSDPPLWAVLDLRTFLHWTVPVLIVVSAALALINGKQQETRLHAALTRFLWAKAAFWCVVELSFYQKSTVLYVLLDWAIVAAVAGTSVDLLIRLFRRYVLVRRDGAPEERITA